MENDDFFIKKKTGMTITRAWLLFLGMLVLLLVYGSVRGYQMAKNGQNLEEDAFGDSVFLINLVSYSILGVAAFLINKREFPRIKNIDLKYYLVAFVMGLGVRFVLTILDELPNSLISNKVMEQIYEFGFVILIPSLILIFVQVGLIGHGLLRNYKFSTAVFTTSLISLINFEPKAIIALILLTSLGLFLYYKSESIFTLLAMCVPYLMSDLVVHKIAGGFDFESNFYRNLLGNDILYAVVYAVSLLALALGVWFFAQLPKVEWQRNEDIFDF